MSGGGEDDKKEEPVPLSQEITRGEEDTSGNNGKSIHL